MGCVSSVKYSVLLDGKYSVLLDGTSDGFFQAQRGRRVANAFSSHMIKGIKGNFFRGFKVGENEVEVADLPYAEDTILFVDADCCRTA